MFVLRKWALTQSPRCIVYLSWTTNQAYILENNTCKNSNQIIKENRDYVIENELRDPVVCLFPWFGEVPGGQASNKQHESCLKTKRGKTWCATKVR